MKSLNIGDIIYNILNVIIKLFVVSVVLLVVLVCIPFFIPASHRLKTADIEYILPVYNAVNSKLIFPVQISCGYWTDYLHYYIGDQESNLSDYDYVTRMVKIAKIFQDEIVNSGLRKNFRIHFESSYGSGDEIDESATYTYDYYYKSSTLCLYEPFDYSILKDFSKNTYICLSLDSADENAKAKAAAEKYGFNVFIE
jgi:hypothetical protein